MFARANQHDGELLVDEFECKLIAAMLEKLPPEEVSDRELYLYRRITSYLSGEARELLDVVDLG